jgi:methylthioribose-1-phosphate isomerase
MLVDGKNYQSIWLDKIDRGKVMVIDQKRLPFFFEIKELCSVEDIYSAIKDMTLRGAPLIGAAGAYGIYLATLEMNSLTNIPDHLANASRYITSCRPTAVNLSWAVKYVMDKLKGNFASPSLSEIALDAANEVCETEKENCRRIGNYGINLIEDISKDKKGEPVNILTHCNAGWLACIDYGTALSPVYFAHDKGIPVHVWIDETRPLNQGARLTTWELGNHGVPYTLITDNTGGFLMQKGKVDIVLVGSDRTTRKGDSANKIGTYLKALAALDNKIPFYVALPSTSIDFSLSDGIREIPVEERAPDEVTSVNGLVNGEIGAVRICPEGADAANWGFDITPARLITGLITEKGICRAEEKDIRNMFSNKFK